MLLAEEQGGQGLLPSQILKGKDAPLHPKGAALPSHWPHLSGFACDQSICPTENIHHKAMHNN